MRVLALISGGKDSCYNSMLCKQHGHEIIALGNLCPLLDTIDELDSYMYQTVGHQIVVTYAACAGLPLFRRRLTGSTKQQGLIYDTTDGDEVEDLLALLAFAKQQLPQLQAVSSGAIASDYQRLRVEQVCARLGLTSLAYMWHQPQARLLSCMVQDGVHAVLCKVAAMGLKPEKHLGKPLADMQPFLHSLRRLYQCNVCGEGGEYESLVLDCPLFRQARIVLDQWEIVLQSPDSFAPVGLLHPVAFHLEPKQPGNSSEAPDSLSPPATLSVARDNTAVPSANADSKLATTETFSQAQDAPQQSPAAAAAAAAAKTAQTSDDPAEAPFGHAGTQLSSAATVIEVPTDFTWAAATPQAQGVQSNQPDTANWEASVPLQCGSMYVRAVCQPTQIKQVAASGAATAEALEAAISAISAELAVVSLSLRSALFVHLYLADMAHFAAANAAYCRHFPAVSPSARACIQAPLPAGCPVMLEVLLPSTAEGAARRKVLHVQSISGWAPSCIGPYSQATTLGGLLRMAGQIGLDPSTMQLVSGRFQSQLIRCLKSCQDVGVACQSNLSNALLTCTVYTAQQGGNQEDWHTIGNCLDAFLTGNIDQAYAKDSADAKSSNAEIKQASPDNQAATAASDESGDDSQYAASEATADADIIDDYLQAPTMHRHWHPLVLIVGVPGLPKGALVEVQPEACNLEALAEGHSRDSSSDDDEPRQLPQSSEHVIDKRRANWGRCLVNDNGISAGDGIISWSSLTSVGAYCCCQAALYKHAESVDSDMQGIVSVLSNALTAAKLTAQDIASTTVFVQEGLEHLQNEFMKAFQVCWTLQHKQRLPVLCVLVQSLASGVGAHVIRQPQPAVVFKLTAHSAILKQERE